LAPVFGKFKNILKEERCQDNVFGNVARSIIYGMITRA
jgi:hypothetical protein